MNKSTSERYLGDVITADCKIDENIVDRHNKGLGYTNEIIVILEEITLGHYYFESALTLRNAKLINGMLCSIESVYVINTRHLE